jgi:hypothetical protein
MGGFDGSGSGGGNIPGGADSDCAPGSQRDNNDVLYGFGEDIKKQMANLAPNQTIITAGDNINTYINNPESPEKPKFKPYSKTIKVLE